MPKPGTHEDSILLADLNHRLDDEFKVKVWRGKCLGVGRQLKGAEGGWVEIVPRPAEDDTMRGDSMINNLQGAKAFGAERLFWDRDQHSLVAIIWFGGAISGWPGVTHGGAIATALSDKAALAATLAEGLGTSISAAATPQRMPGTGSHAKIFVPETLHDDPTQMSLSYLKPTYANNFYVVRIGPSLDLEQDPVHIVPSHPAGVEDYEATLEAMDGKVSKLQQVEDKILDAAKLGYGEFKQWMWPSRQSNSQAG
ncbi:hypothetical protein LTR78_006950 [Recurvomyces mirabilis]|uniref:Uncharacterized protein n=1 Tax=Recurvomyces mirabilis TaxID=574656 RepID=A0AAE0WJZ6_9PEZI|nr:hypothetical protein LTR78_006950 [Recurvomyces mirabilis]KAK5153334.1 hypothetical protein LTS14_007503 [Recurvomyces mirabilis]